MPTITVPPEGRRYPQMSRQVPDGHHCPHRPRDRRCATRDIPTSPLARTTYDRMLHTAGPADPAAAAVLNVMLDAAGDTLADVLVGQETIGDRLRARHPGAPTWGTGTATVRRATRALEDLGFISVEDVPIPGRDGLHTLRYRFHVPAHATEVWDRIVENTERRRARRAADATTRRATPASTPPAAAELAPGPAGEPDDPDQRPDRACEEAAGVANGLHRQGFPLAEILTLLAHRWAPGTAEYQAGERIARLRAGRAAARQALSGARAGP